MDHFYYHGKLFEPTAFFFHPQIWGGDPTVFYFLLSDVNSKPFMKTALNYLCWLLSPFLILFLFFNSAALSVPLLPGYRARWRPNGRSGNGNSPVKWKAWFVCLFSITASAITCLSLLEHLWLFCEHKTTGGMSASSPLLPHGVQGQVPDIHSCYSLELL